MALQNPPWWLTKTYGTSLLGYPVNPPVAALYTPLGDVEEIFNPLGVSLGASES